MTSPRYKLWHGAHTRGLRVLWTLEELGQADAVEVIRLAYPPRETVPEYLEVNPLGSLPFFTDGDIEISESMAICQYLVAQHQGHRLAIAPTENGFADYLQFCFFGEASLMPPIGNLARQFLAQPAERSDVVLREATIVLARRLGALTAQLSAKQYLAGDRFTLADIAVGFSLGLAKLLGHADLFDPILADYLAMLEDRPAHQRAYAR